MTQAPINPKEFVKILEDNQAQDIVVLDVQMKTALTDHMIIATARSSRHVKAIADKLILAMKEQGVVAHHAHGLAYSDWALIDFGDCIVHIMLPEVRAFYNLESLWQSSQS